MEYDVALKEAIRDSAKSLLDCRKSKNSGIRPMMSITTRLRL